MEPNQNGSPFEPPRLVRRARTSEYYHIQVTPITGLAFNERMYNVDRDWVESRVVAPRANGMPITINGMTLTMDKIIRISVKRSNGRLESSQFSRSGWGSLPAIDVTDQFISGPPGATLADIPGGQLETRPNTGAREVFVVHGRNAAARDALFEFLRSIDLHPMEWSEAVQLTGKPMPYIGEILDAAFSHAHAIVVLLTPDDEARLREVFLAAGDPSHESELTGQARPNVLFEAGMAMSRDEARTILVELGNLRPFSDIAGRHTIRFDNSTQRRQELASRLTSAGCPVNLSGTDWHSAGDFIAALELVNVNADANETDQTSELSEDAKDFLIAAVQSNRGAVTKISTAGGSLFIPTPPNIDENDRGRLSARLQQALDDLINHGLVSDGPPFSVTHKGYLTVDELQQ